MNHDISLLVGLPVLAAAGASLFLLGMFTYKKALNTSRVNAALIFLLALATSAASMFYRDSMETQHQINVLHRFGVSHEDAVWVIIAAGLLPLVAIPFLINLYQRWIGGRLSEAEKAPGMEGIRAWLRGGNLICALFIAIFACIGYSYSFWGVLALTVMTLLAYPILNMASTSFQPVAPKTEDLSPERDRVLRMLDEGKINAEESAELLNALGQTLQSPRAPALTAADPHRKMVLTGLVLLLIGFFLPWFSINLGDEMGRVFSGMQEQMNEIAKQNPGVPITMPNTGSVRISGGEIRYGLGWFVLLLGIAAAALPYLANHLPADCQHKARLITLGAGSSILIYLLTENLRFVSIGILLGLAGYALQWIGTLKERQSAR